MKIKQAPSQIERVMTAPTFQPKEVKPVPLASEQQRQAPDTPLDHLVGQAMAQQMSRNEENRSKRQERIPFGQSGRQYAVTEIPGYHLHGIVDWHPQMANRIEQALRAGYQFVSQSEVEVTYGHAENSSDLSDRVSRTVGTRPSGEPITEYLMKIPLEFYAEHQQVIADHANKVDAAIKRGAVGGKVGKDGRYIPTNTTIKLSSEIKEGDPDEVLGKP